MKFTRAAIGAQSARNDKGGAVLMLYALLVFALLGMAALCIDIGFASLSQTQMQTAADTAALEGMRLRDFHVYRAFGAQYVRPRVGELVRQVFDDDMHPTQGVAPTTTEPLQPGAPPPPGALAPDDEDELKLGAGPIYRLSDAIGPSNESAHLTAPARGERTAAESWIDDPILQPNSSNRASGDMVTGTFSAFGAHREDENYVRGDFTPASPVPYPPSVYQSIGFLVRMRRTTGADPLDQAAGVSSRGVALPLLFGMGALIRSDSGASYDPRRDGLSVRATAIAVGRPPLSIGPPIVGADGAPMIDRIGFPIRGVGYWYYPAGIGSPALRRHVTVAWEQGFWANEFGPNPINHVPIPDESATPPQTLTVLPTGAIELNPGARRVGHLLVAPCDFASHSDTCPDTVGTSLGMSVDVDLSQPPYLLTVADMEAILLSAGFAFESAAGIPLNTARCYMPIYAPVVAPNGATSNRIIAFGYGTLSGTPGLTSKFAVTKGWPGGGDDAGVPPEPSCMVLIAPDNTTSVLSRRAPALSASEWTQVFDQNLDFVYPGGNASYDWHNVRPGTVLTPVLAR